MKQLVATVVLVVTALIAVTSPSSADVGVAVVFSDKEISIIGAWYQDHEQSHGKRGKKAKGLPPGIAKNLTRGKPLPPGVAKQYLPTDLRELLPETPNGFERIIVDGKVLLVEIATRVIHDILVDVVLD